MGRDRRHLPAAIALGLVFWLAGAATPAPAEPRYDPGAGRQTLNNQIVVLPDGTLILAFSELPTTENGAPAQIGVFSGSFDGFDGASEIKLVKMDGSTTVLYDRSRQAAPVITSKDGKRRLEPMVRIERTRYAGEVAT